MTSKRPSAVARRRPQTSNFQHSTPNFQSDGEGQNPEVRSDSPTQRLWGRGGPRNMRFCETNPPVNYQFCKYLGGWPWESGWVGSGKGDRSFGAGIGGIIVWGMTNGRRSSTTATDGLRLTTAATTDGRRHAERVPYNRRSSLRQVAGGECFLTNGNFHGPLTRIVVSHIVRLT